MKQLLFWLVTAAVLAGSAAAGYRYFYLPRYGAGSGKYRTVAVRRGDVTQIVNSTGTVQPVLSVQVGSFVSGPVLKVFVDFNDHVKTGPGPGAGRSADLQGAVASAKAGLLHSQADLIRVQALLDQARRDEKRAQQLHPTNAISETDFDQCLANRKSLEAQVKLAEATIQESQGQPGHGRRRTSNSPTSGRRWTGSSPTGRSIPGKPWPRSSRPRCCSWLPPIWRKKSTSTPRSTRPTSA